jgi:hypothetical protein
MINKIHQYLAEALNVRVCNDTWTKIKDSVLEE